MDIKKVISSFTSIVMVVTLFSMSASANSVDSSSFVYKDNVDPEYTVAYNTFETVAKENISTYFTVVDFDEEHGKVLKAYSPKGRWAQIGETGKPTTYTWNGQTYNMLWESCEVGKNYILTYDNYVDADVISTNEIVSLAPQHDAFYGTFTTGKYYCYPDTTRLRTWNHNVFEFTASESTLKMWFNTMASGVTNYFDNIIVVEAAKVNITDASGATTIKDTLGTFVSGSDSLTGGTWVSKGMPAKFSIETGPIMSVTSVMHGSIPIQPDADGYYYIEKVTDDLTVNVDIAESAIKELVSIDGTDIYLPIGTTRNSLASSSGIHKNCITFVNSASKKLKNDERINPGEKVFFNIVDIKTPDYTVKLLGDYDSSGTVNVTDLLAGVQHVLTGNSEVSEVATDFDQNGIVNITDIVKNRNAILNYDATDYPVSDEFLTTSNEFIADCITQTSITDITTDNFEKGIYNEGNRTRIANVIKKIMRKEEVTIAYFGGSITAGTGYNKNPTSASGLTPTNSTSKNTYADWISKWWQSLASHYGAEINFVNAGIGSTDTPYAVHRMHHDVLPYDPDLVVVEWCVNDTQQYSYKQGTYEAMVRQFLDADVALLMLSMCTQTGNSSQVLHEPISDLYDVPMLSYRDAYIDNPKFTYFTTDKTHPNIVGHPMAGILCDYFFQSIYEEIATIGYHDSPMPTTLVHEDADDYDGAYIASFKDIYDGKIEGARIKDMGSFAFETKITSYGGGIRKYYAMYANAAASYKPVVIEVDNLKTAFALVYRDGMYSPQATFNIKLDGTIITDPTFTCKHGDDNAQTETTNHWATNRICYRPHGGKATIEIYPTIDYTAAPDAKIRLFALLLS